MLSPLSYTSQGKKYIIFKNERKGWSAESRIRVQVERGGMLKRMVRRSLTEKVRPEEKS